MVTKVYSKDELSNKLCLYFNLNLFDEFAKLLLIIKSSKENLFEKSERLSVIIKWKKDRRKLYNKFCTNEFAIPFIKKNRVSEFKGFWQETPTSQVGKNKNWNTCLKLDFPEKKNDENCILLSYQSAAVETFFKFCQF